MHLKHIDFLSNIGGYENPLLKRWLLATHQNYIGDDYLSYYLDEYTFRYNRRKSNSRGLLFQRFVEQAVTHEHVEYKLIKRM